MAPQKQDVNWPYPVGTPGQPWGDAEKKTWAARQLPQRSYLTEVVEKLTHLAQEEAFSKIFEVVCYGALTNDPTKFPLHAVVPKSFAPDKPSVLVTGGVHGYETSGVQGAFHFLENSAVHYSSHFNLVVAPCVSPWGYEHIQRWNVSAQDPNRSFKPSPPVENEETWTEESRALMRLVGSAPEGTRFLLHLDLHETTDTDATEFRPAKSAMEGKEEFDYEGELALVDGFFLVGDAGGASERGRSFVGGDKSGTLCLADVVREKAMLFLHVFATTRRLVGCYSKFMS